MISEAQWASVDARAFEHLAVAHVREVYPNVAWVITKESCDGGKDAIGRIENLTSGVAEIYWMEAKNRPYVDHYTIGPHLFAVVIAKNVCCLHVR